MTHRSVPSRADPALDGAESFLFFILGAQSEQPETSMTLPNRPEYRPGEKRRERKGQPDDEPTVESVGLPLPLTKVTLPPLSVIRPVVEVTRPPAAVATETEPAIMDGADGSKKADAALASAMSESELHQELLDALSTFLPENAPDGVKAEGTAGGSASGLAKQRAEVEAAWKRLNADPYFQAHGKQLLGIGEKRSHDKSAAAGPAPSWGVLTESNAQGGNSSTASLQQVKKTMIQELQSVLDKIQDPSVAEGYQQAINDFHQWGMQRLIQQQQQLQQQHLQQRAPVPSASEALAAAGSTSPTTMSMAAMLMPQQAKKRVNLSKNAKAVLRAWFEEHLHHPYPTEEEKEMLSRQGGLTLDQVNNWFINTRGRKWKPMISKLMAQKKNGECLLYDRMVQRIEQPYRSDPMSDL